MTLDSENQIDFTRRILRIPSLSGQENAVVEAIRCEMQTLGFDQVFIDENGSAVGIINGNLPGKTILLDGHCDTVGVPMGSAWVHDPFGAEIENGRLYGRGVADMKGALAAMIHGAAALDREHLPGRVVVSATVDEEVLEGAAIKTVMDQTQPDFVVIGESTRLNLNHGGRGRAEIHVETLGKPAHSSSPQLGINAVYLMMEVIHEINELPPVSHPVIGQSVMALTDILSDPYPGTSVIPSHCEVTYDRRTVPGETPESVLSLMSTIDGTAKGRYRIHLAEGKHETHTGKILGGQKFFPAWVLEDNHILVQQAVAGLRALGQTPQLGVYQFCTNGSYSAGIAGIPTIGYGPGSEGDAHVIDEQVLVSELVEAARGYQAIVQTVLASRN